MWTPQQRRLLRRLSRSLGRTVTHDALIFALWGHLPAGEPEHARNHVRVLVCRLRDKGCAIRSDPRVGYALMAPVALPAVDDEMIGPPPVDDEKVAPPGVVR